MSKFRPNFEFKPPSTRSVMSFLFMPEIKRSFPAFAHIGPVFIRTIAIMFAQSGLLPPNHPALMYGLARNVPKFKFSDVMGEAWYNLRRGEGVSAYHYGLFFSVIMMLCTVVAGALIFITNLFVGVASAQLFSHPSGAATDFASVGAAGGTGLFPTNYTAQSGDLAITLLDQVFRHAVLGNGAPLQNGLGPLMLTYNTAVLVVAAIAVFWAIISIIIDTARTGQVGGQRHSIVWVPIRFVFSLGLMIPLASGFNSGQVIMLKFAEWGSNLGSSGWVDYVASVTNGASLIAGTDREEQTDIAVALARVWTCRTTYNMLLQQGDGLTANTRIVNYPQGLGRRGGTGGAIVGPLAQNQILRPSQKTVQVRIGNRAAKGICGGYKITNPEFTGLAGGNNVPAVYEAATRTIRRGHVQGFFAMMPGARNIACGIAHEYNEFDGNITCSGANGGGNGAGADTGFGDGVLPDIAEINGMVAAYDNQFNGQFTAARNALQGFASSGVFLDEVRRGGWAAMGVWYHTISRLNNVMAEENDSGISITSGNLEQLAGAKTFLSFFRDRSKDELRQKVAETLGKFDIWWDDSAVGAAANSEAGRAVERFSSVSKGPATQSGDGTSSLADILEKILPAGNTVIVDAFESTNNGGQPIYPMAQLAGIGNNIVGTAVVAYGVIVAAQLASSSLGVLGQIPGLGAAAKGINYIMGGPVGSLISTLLFSLMGAGLILKYYIPLLPWIRVTFAVLSWLVSLFEAIVILPLLALMNLSTEGEGLFTQTGRNLWIMALNVLFRPVLTVLGYVGALLVFNAMVQYVNTTFEATLASVQGPSFLFFLNSIVYTVVYIAVIYVLTNSTFKMVDTIPNALMRWLGGPQDNDFQDSQLEGIVSAGGSITSGLSQGLANSSARIVDAQNKPPGTTG